jgi:kynurenine formamidase
MRCFHVCSSVVLVACAAQSLTAQSHQFPGQFAAALREGRVVDLTHTFNRDTIYWPTEEGFKLVKEKAGFTDKGYYYAANRMIAAEHGGTHIDAPIHFSARGQTVDAIPLKRLIGEAAVIDVSEACKEHPDYQVGIEDLRRWEEAQQRQLIDVIVLLRTGYAKRWPNRKAYLGTNATGPEAIAELHFPGLSPQAAEWLTQHRSIKAVGIDTASIDYGQSKRFASHVTLFEYNVPAMENVGDMSRLPTAGATIIALPMKIGGGSGSPIRVLAILPTT